MKATKAWAGFHETLPSPNALRSVAEDIHMNQAGTRMQKDIQASLAGVKSNLGKKKKEKRIVQRLDDEKTLHTEKPAGTINLH